MIGDKPGLVVWDRHRQQWISLEMSYGSPAGSLLVGRQLELLSNGRYLSGGHLVASYPDASEDLSQTQPNRSSCRYSIVFVLRAHSPVPVDTDELTTAITGPHQNPLRGIKADNLFADLKKAHYNVNTGLQEREQQRRDLAEKKNAKALERSTST